jgi:signal transduction histidine kinase
MGTVSEIEILKTKLEIQETVWLQTRRALDDEIVQILSGAKLLLGVSDRTPNETPEAMLMVEEMLGKAIKDIRALCYLNYDNMFNPFHLIQSLNEEIILLNIVRELNVTLEIVNESLMAGMNQQIVFFRIVQETIEHCVNGLKANTINVQIRKTDQIDLEIISGFSNTKNHGKAIPESLLNRVHRSAGFISEEHTDLHNTIIRIKLPTQPNNYET